MAKIINKYRFICKCLHCNNEIRALNQHCPSCGLTEGRFASNAPGNSHFLICKNCSFIINSKIIPELCAECNKNNIKWWDQNIDGWFAPDLKQLYKNNPDTVWLTGDFDGDLIGDSNEDQKHEGAVKGNELFNLKIAGGNLENVSSIDGPPLEILLNEVVHPIRQNPVDDVTLKVDSNYASVSLFDFRLHQWIELKDHHLDEGRIYARIKGKAYGCINPGDKDLKVEPNVQQKVNIPTITLNKPDIQNNNGSSPKSGDSSDYDCKFCSYFSRFIAFIILLLVCDFVKALIGVLGITATCLFDRYSAIRGWKTKSQKSEIALSFLLIFIALISNFYLYDFFLKFSCSHNFGWLILVLLLCFIFSAWLHKCLPKTILCVLWIIGLLISCDHDCGGKVNRLNSIAQNLQNDVANAFSQDNLSNQVSSASQVSEDGKIITLEEAMQNPSLLKNCKNKLYLPNAMLFETNKYKINKDSDRSLNQLLTLFTKLDKNTHITITGHSDELGDATSQGFLHNIQLSEQRASSVAFWLTNHGAQNVNKIDIQGVGSKFPLVPEPISALNRRVEIHLTCESGK